MRVCTFLSLSLEWIKRTQWLVFSTLLAVTFVLAPYVRSALVNSFVSVKACKLACNAGPFDARPRYEVHNHPASSTITNLVKSEYIHPRVKIFTMMAAGDLEGVISLRETANDPIAIYFVGLAYYLNGDDAMAARVWRGQRSISHRLVALSKEATERGEVDVSLRWAQVGLGTYPTDPRFWYSVGCAKQEQGDFPEAERYLLKAASLSSGDRSGILFQISRLYSQQKRYTDALVVLESAVADNSDSAVLWYELGVIYTRTGDASRAVMAFLNALRLGYDEGYIWRPLGKAYAMLGQYSEAINAYVRALDFCDSPVYQLELGQILQSAGRIAESQTAFERAVRPSTCRLPDDELARQTAYIRLGGLYMDAQERDQARATYLEFLRRYPESERADQVRQLLKSLDQR